MSSSVSLLPTIEFLEQIASVQFGTESSYGIGFSKLKPEFFSTTNSEWLCLNSESEFLTSSIENVKIKNPFEYSRNDSSPVHIAVNELSVKSNVLSDTNSIFLYRLNGKNQEIITVSNYDKNPDNITTAPPLDCFSRECLSWFGSDIDWFVGFGDISGSLNKLEFGDNVIVISKSENILSSLIEGSEISCPYSNISVLGSITTLSPFVNIQFSTSAEYNQTPNYNCIFLYNSDNIVSFACQFEEPQRASYNTIDLNISFSNDDIIII